MVSTLGFARTVLLLSIFLTITVVVLPLMYLHRIFLDTTFRPLDSTIFARQIPLLCTTPAIMEVPLRPSYYQQFVIMEGTLVVDSCLLTDGLSLWSH